MLDPKENPRQKSLTQEEKLDLAILKVTAAAQNMELAMSALARIITYLEPLVKTNRDLEPILSAVKKQFIIQDGTQIRFKLPGLFS